MNRKRLAIIGNGMAAGRLLDELVRRNAPSLFDIAVYGEEPHGCYNRILLSRIIGGGSADEITLKTSDWYAARGVTYHSGTIVSKLDSTTRTLLTSTGEPHEFDVAVFATGSRPLVPPLEGLRTKDTHRSQVHSFFERSTTASGFARRPDREVAPSFWAAGCSASKPPRHSATSACT